MIASPDMDDATRAEMEQWTGCIAGALTRDEFEEALTAAGLEDVEIRATHARPRVRQLGDHPGTQAGRRGVLHPYRARGLL